MSELAIFGGEPVRKKLFPAHKFIGEEEKREVNRVMDSGILSRYLGCWHQDFYGGPEVQAFENEWSEHFNVKHALAVNSCSSGLQAAIGAIGIQPGDEVIVSPYTMSASVTAALWYGAIPVFADIEEEYFCLDPKSVEAKITDKTKAIIIVDIFGQPYDAEAIDRIAKKNNLIIIEDCAQAPFARYRDRWAGTLGDIGVFSLNYHKHIHTGEGGMVVTDNHKFAERLSLIRNHAEAVVEEKGVKNLVNMVGANFRLTEIQAAIGRVQLMKLRTLVESRRNNCSYLAERLEKIPGIYSPKVRADCTHSYYLQPFLYKEEVIGVSRDKFINAVKAELPVTELRELEGQQIDCGYVKPIYLLPLFQERIAFGSRGYPFSLRSDHAAGLYGRGTCPVAEKMHFKELFTNEFMRPPATAEDLDDVVAAFEKVYKYRDELKD